MSAPGTLPDAGPVFLAVDLGAESGRVMAGCVDDAGVHLEETHRFPNGFVTLPGPGGEPSLRWDVAAIWGHITDGLTKAATRFGGRVRSVGVDTWGVDHVLLSATGELLGLPFAYRDSRTEGGFEDAFAAVPKGDIFAATGLQFLPFNSLYQLRATRRDHPELLAAAARVQLMGDYFHRLLCGSDAVEFTNAGTTQLVDPRTRDWDRDLIAKLDLPDAIFGPVVPPGTDLGPVFGSVCEAAGLPAGTRVVAPATHDTASAVVAVPTERTGSADWAYISSGTWSLVGVETAAPVLTPAALAVNATNEGGVDGTTRLLKNVMGLWLVQGVRKSLAAASGRAPDYAELATLAEAAPGLRSLIDPDDTRFLAPADMAAAVRGFCSETGQPVPEGPGELVRCCLDSLALRYAKVLDELAGLTGTRPGVVHVVGGGSRNALLNRLTAEACGVPVVAGPAEATALGNVLVQARTAGAVGDLAAMRVAVRRSSSPQTFEPSGDGNWAAAAERVTAFTT